MPTTPETSSLTEAVKDAGRRVGFVRLGIAAPSALDGAQPLIERWVARGHHGQMSYLAEFGTRHARFRASLHDIKSLLIVAASYAGHPPPTGPGQGKVARYAAGKDYHRVLDRRLKILGGELERLAGRPLRLRSCVDTAPIHERALAREAGVGFIGKNTCLIVTTTGSWVVLGLLATDLSLTPDAPLTTSHCGSCTRCLEACPTQALTAPYEMDARRCIAYLTLEHRGSIPEPMRDAMGS